MQKHAYTHTTKYIWLFLIIITITLNRRDSSSSSCKVYSLHALKKPCQFKLLKYSFLNTHFKWVHSKPILKCQIHTRLCQKHTKFTQTQMFMSVNTNSWMCISLWDLWNDVSWRWWQHTMELNQASPPHTFLAYALGGIYLNAGYCDMYVPRRKPRTAIVFKNSTYTENNSLWRNLKLFRSFSCKNSNITHYSKH